MTIDKNAIILDVRTSEEFEGQHVPGAINIPVDQIPYRMDEIKKMPKPIIAYCRSGARSGMAVNIMKQNGITEAMNGGGIGDMLLSLK